MMVLYQSVTTSCCITARNLHIHIAAQHMKITAPKRHIVGSDIAACHLRTLGGHGNTAGRSETYLLVALLTPPPFPFALCCLGLYLCSVFGFIPNTAAYTAYVL